MSGFSLLKRRALKTLVLGAVLLGFQTADLQTADAQLLVHEKMSVGFRGGGIFGNTELDDKLGPQFNIFLRRRFNAKWQAEVGPRDGSVRVCVRVCPYRVLSCYASEHLEGRFQVLRQAARYQRLHLGPAHAHTKKLLRLGAACTALAARAHQALAHVCARSLARLAPRLANMQALFNGG